MADNNIQLDLSINEKSIDSAWLPVEKAAAKSAKDSAAFFEEAFKGVAHSSATQFNAAFKAQAKGQELIPKEAGFKAVQSLTDVASALYLVKQGFELVKAAANATLDVVLEGDRIVKIERRFEAFAMQAGVAAGVLQGELKQAVNGFVDDTELLELASEAFVRLGNNATELPKVLEAARKTYAVFGGSVVDNSRKIISAAETGSARSLKDIGLYIDLDGALKKYATTLGTVPRLLTAQQKEQGRLAAILAEAETRLGAVQVKAGATTSYTQLKVALNDLNDEFSKIANSKLGAIFQTLADYAKIVVTNIGEGLKRIRPAETLNEMAEKLDRLRANAAKYEKQLVELGTASELGIGASLKAQLITIRAQIADYRELIRVKGVDAKVKAATTEDPAQIEERLKRRAEVVAKSLELNNQLNASEVALLQAKYARTQQEADLDALNKAQKIQAEEAYLQQSTALKKFYADNATATQEQIDAGELALKEAHKNKMLAIDMAYAEERKKINAEASAAASVDIQSTGDAIAAIMLGMSNTMLTQAKSMKATLMDLGKAFVNTFQKQLTGAIIAFAQGTKTGEEALHDMFNSVLNAMAEMLISQGLGFILQGTAMAWAGVPNGAPLITAGSAMVAFGAGLAAVTAANGGAVGATGGGAGGGASGAAEAATGNTSNPTTPIADTTPTTPSAVVNLNIERFVDRQAEGLWIADLLTERFEQDGVIVRST